MRALPALPPPGLEQYAMMSLVSVAAVIAPEVDVIQGGGAGA
jgi:hypothetical protein